MMYEYKPALYAAAKQAFSAIRKKPFLKPTASKGRQGFLWQLKALKRK